MATLHLEIVTPESVSYSDEVDSVVVPGVEGEIGVMPNHIPLITLLQPGELRVSQKGRETSLAVGTGVVEITPEGVSVLTDMAVGEDAIDEKEAEAAAERARKALAGQSLQGEELQAMEAMLQKSLAQLNLKRRRRS